MTMNIVRSRNFNELSDQMLNRRGLRFVLSFTAISYLVLTTFAILFVAFEEPSVEELESDNPPVSLDAE